MSTATADATGVPTTGKPRKERIRHRPITIGQVILQILMAIASIAMALPFLWMFFSSFKPLEEIFMQPPKLLPMNWQPQNYSEAFDQASAGGAWYASGFPLAFFNSFYISTVVTLGTLLTSAMAAYAFARIRFFGRGFWFMLFLSTMMVPGQLTIIPLYIIMGQLDWVDTHLPLIIPPILFNAFGVFLLRQYARGIPLELEEAAAIDGAGRFRIFVSLILPLLKSPMVALGIFTFLGQWNNFFYPLIFLNSSDKFTLPLLVNQFKGAYSSNWAGIMAASTITALPLLIVFIFAQRQIVEGIALSGSKT
ncbi:carbohydrate ABC transporter permease [Aestuariimicrobium ganziense]|uniref:carbohydrate ABC transporter permease n=1 Tax=Aestuariimicrobium ganziense TaxID=2773677 RepID=UPI001940DA7B|nr:carbohydrate ABC transporter permease [Aestuariimicrobium ganziense]